MAGYSEKQYEAVKRWRARHREAFEKYNKEYMTKYYENHVDEYKRKRLELYYKMKKYDYKIISKVFLKILL